MRASQIEPALWKRIAPFLDRALEVEPQQREAWLIELTTLQPEIAHTIRAMLAERDALDARGFLAHSPLHGVATRAGMRVGAYTLERMLGRGGMGEVWLARRDDGRFEGNCAIKFLEGSVGWSSRVDRFRLEGQVLARLTHPNIARLLDAGTGDDGVPFLALEYIDGVRIDHYCEAQALTVIDRVRLFVNVIAAVAHAHSHLIIHRDLKPSNVLVTGDGQVKLLDFGIAKLLSPDPEFHDNQTRIDEAALTPEYAAPEQMLGDLPSTATDVYQLGLLLYVLLARKHPLQLTGTRAEKIRLALDGVIRPASLVASLSVARQLRGDLDAIIAKAVRKAPGERYATAQALQEDLLRYLNREPVHARRGAALYRVRRFVARNRVAAVAALAIVASLSIGLYAANRERVKAEQRFEQVRQLSNKLFDIDRKVRDLPGSVATRQLIVETSLEYLGRLADDVGDDPELALDLGNAYIRVARVQGIPIASNLGEMDKAYQTLEKAALLVDSVLAAQPQNRLAFLRRAQISHDRMIVAGLRRPDDDALPLARESAAWLDKYLESGSVGASEAEQAIITLLNVGNRFRIEEQFDEALRLTLRAQVVAAAFPEHERHLGSVLISLARIQRDRGALDDAIKSYEQAATILENAHRANGGTAILKNFALALIDRAELLDQEASVSLLRTAEAVTLFKRAFEIVDGIAHRDPDDAHSRELLTAAAQPLASLLRNTSPTEALEIQDHALRHLAEVTDNEKARRYEARSLAASATLLQRMGRMDEARKRLEGARMRLEKLKLHPAARVEAGSEAEEFLMALAEFQVASGDIAAGLATCETLLGIASASDLAPEEDLPDAAEVSYLYATVAAIQRRAGKAESATALEARRKALWQHWIGKRPDDVFVRTRLATPEPR